MLFWIFGFFAIPAVLLLGGYLMANHPTQRSNALCGYRTERSLQSEETWYFAQDYCGHLWLKVGGILLIPSFLSLVLLRSREYRHARPHWASNGRALSLHRQG